MTTGYGARRSITAGEAAVQQAAENPTNVAFWGGVALGGAAAPSDGMTFGVINGQLVVSMLYNGTNLDRARTDSTHKFNTFAVGAGTIWTPGAGKKFRLRGIWYTIASNSIQAVAGIESIRLTDGGANFGPAFDLFVPGAAGPTGPPLLDVLLVYQGNGYLSTAANNSLASTITANLTGGEGQVYAWGTEE